MTFRNLVPLLFVATICGCGAEKPAANVVRRDGQPDFVRPKDEATMTRAMQKAKDTQSQFVTALAANKASAMGFAVKKPFPIGDSSEGGEHIWLTEVTWDGKVFSAVVNNNPVDTKAVKFGDKVQVTPEELSDWMYFDDGKLQGGYTIRALYHEASPEEKMQMQQEMPFEVPAIDF